MRPVLGSASSLKALATLATLSTLAGGGRPTDAWMTFFTSSGGAATIT